MAKRSIPSDYLCSHNSVRSFYQYSLQSINFKGILFNKSEEQIDRKTIKQSLKKQYASFSNSEKTQQYLAEIEQENCFTITTGHQIGLFGGPMYVVYKVMTVIRLAEQLRAELNVPIVPIFWIHTEDHDFEEINHYFPEFGKRIRYEGSFQSAVGQHILEDQIQDIIPPHFSPEMKAAWQPKQALKDAFFRFAHTLFDQYGLLILDANQPELKRLFIPQMREELLSSPTEKRINQSSQALIQAGYKAQITPRPINLFYLDEQGRDRIIRQGDQYQILNRDTVFTQSEILQELTERPEKFSPNVALRPLYQESILPNLAYVGGWGELSYWMQLKGVFQHFNRNLPLLLPRMSATVFKQEQAEAWHELGFQLPDIHKKRHELYEMYLPNIWDEAEFQPHIQQLQQQFEALEAYLSSIEPTMTPSVKGQWVKTEKFLQRTLHKLKKSIRNQQPQAFRQIDQLKWQIQPDGTKQERVLGIASFQQMTQLIELAYQNCQPLQFHEVFLKLP